MTIEIDNIKIDRNDLAQFLPNLRAIRAFETMSKAVSGTIPDAVNQNTDDLESLANEVGLSATQAMAALTEAAIALALANQATVEYLTGQIAEQREQIAGLLSTINDLKQGYQL